MKIAIFAKNTHQGYSGGRYYSWLIAQSLAGAGHAVTYHTNCVPEFLADFRCDPNFSKIKLVISEGASAVTSFENHDIVLVIPHLAYTDAYYSEVSEYAVRCGAKLAMINFETPNWFNERVPSRDAALWENWMNLTRRDCLILSLTKTGMHYAKQYYTRFPGTTYFDYAYPPINDALADSMSSMAREKRIVIITRFSDAHKGGDHILDLLTPEMSGYTVVIIVGNKKVGYQQQQALVRSAQVMGIRIELLLGVREETKFREIKKAALMLYPSTFEGYGYPPVEAGYCSTPCICFDLPVLREVNAGQVLYVPLGDYAEFRNAIGGFLRGEIVCRPDALHYTFAKPLSFAERLESIFTNYLRQTETNGTILGEGISAEIDRTANDYDCLLAHVARQMAESEESTVSIYGAGKNGYLLYGLLAALGVSVSEVYDDLPGRCLGTHITTPFDHANSRDLVWIAISSRNPSAKAAIDQVRKSGRETICFG